MLIVTRAVLGLAAALLALFLYGFWAYQYPTPYSDDFVFVDFALQGEPGWAGFFAQYIEGRPVMIRLLAYADYHLTRGLPGMFPALGLLVQMLVAGLLLVRLRHAGMAPALHLLVAALLLVLLFRAYTLELYLWMTGAQLVLATAFAVLALYLATLPQAGPWHLLAACLAGLLAALCHGNGFSVWFIIAGLAWLAGKRFFWLPLLAGLGWIAVYLSLYDPQAAQSNPLAALARPLDLLLYLLHWLGAPYSHQAVTRPAGLVLGGVVLAVFLWSGLRLLRVRALQGATHHDMTLPLLAFGLMAFSIASAGLSGLIRLDLGFAQAANPRYGGFHAMASVGALLALLPVIEALYRQNRALLLVLAGLIPLLMLGEQIGSLRYYADKSATLREQYRLVRAGDWSDARLAPLYPVPEQARLYLTRLKQSRAYLYRD